MTPTPDRRRLILPVAAIIVIAVSAAEVWTLTLVAHLVGIPAVAAFLILSAVVGAWLMQREGRKSWTSLVNAYSQGRLPTGQLADAALVLVGGILLILPGLFTDLLGVIFLAPATRPFARKAIGHLVARRASRSGYARFDGTVIRGETVTTQDPDSEPPTVTGEIED